MHNSNLTDKTAIITKVTHQSSLAVKEGKAETGKEQQIAAMGSSSQ